jgi:hypothetical protein
MHSPTLEVEWDGLLDLVIDHVTIAEAVATMINTSKAIPKRSLVVTLATLGLCWRFIRFDLGADAGNQVGRLNADPQRPAVVRRKDFRKPPELKPGAVNASSRASMKGGSLK